MGRKRRVIRVNTGKPKLTLKKVNAKVNANIKTQEKKHHGVTSSAIEIGFPGGVVGNLQALLTGVPRESGASTAELREGNAIKGVDIVIRGFVQNGTGSPNGSMRICLVRDKRPLSAAASWAEIFETGTVSNLSYLSAYKPENKDRFTVLKDMIINCNQSYNDGTRVANQRKSFRINYTLPKTEVQRFNGATATDVVANHYYLYAAGSSDAVGSSPFISYYSFLRYRDN